MKLIIIIQTLIIIAGGYYVFSILKVKEVQVETAPVLNLNIKNNLPPEGYVPPTENPPVEEDVTASTVIGHSDMGMEFPIPDEELQVR